MLVVPDETPVTEPEASTVAIVLFAVVHKPPVMESVSNAGTPVHNLVLPDIVPASGSGSTLTIAVDVSQVFAA